MFVSRLGLIGVAPPQWSSPWDRPENVLKQWYVFTYPISIANGYRRFLPKRTMFQRHFTYIHFGACFLFKYVREKLYFHPDSCYSPQLQRIQIVSIYLPRKWYGFISVRFSFLLASGFYYTPGIIKVLLTINFLLFFL